MESSSLISLVEEPIFYNHDSNDSFNTININDFTFPFIQKENLFSEEFAFNKIFDFKKFEIREFDNDTSKSIYNEELNQKVNQNESTNNISNIPENTINEISKNVTFKTILHQKRGRKEKNAIIGKKYHGSGDFDNIQRKIQVNFINFLINLANDAVHTILGKESKFIFKDVKYIFKKVVNHSYVEQLKKSKYSDIVQMKVSPKNRSYNEDSNRETYLQIYKTSPELKNFFDKNYLYIFQKYFCEIKNNQNEIDFDGLKIKLSKNTKGLYDLLKKNVDRKEIFLNVVKNVYFRELNYLKNQNPFIICS